MDAYVIENCVSASWVVNEATDASHTYLGATDVKGRIAGTKCFVTAKVLLVGALNPVEQNSFAIFRVHLDLLFSSLWSELLETSLDFFVRYSVVGMGVGVSHDCQIEMAGGRCT